MFDCVSAITAMAIRRRGGFDNIYVCEIGMTHSEPSEDDFFSTIVLI